MACEELYLLKRSVEIPRLVFFGPSWPADDIKGMQNNRHTNVHAHTDEDVHACNVLFVTLKRKKKGEREREKGQPRGNHRCAHSVSNILKSLPHPRGPPLERKERLGMSTSRLLANVSKLDFSNLDAIV